MGNNGSAGQQGSASSNQRSQVPRLKRLNNVQQHNVYTLCHTAEGTQKFRCTECSRTFNLKCTLLRHVRHQHQGRFVPHPCRICGQVFKRTDHLKVHMKKIHRITSATRPNRNVPPDHNVPIGGAESEPLPLPLVLKAEMQQPLALTKDHMIPDRLSKDSDASQN